MKWHEVDEETRRGLLKDLRCMDYPYEDTAKRYRYAFDALIEHAFDGGALAHIEETRRGDRIAELEWARDVALIPVVHRLRAGEIDDRIAAIKKGEA